MTDPRFGNLLWACMPMLRLARDDANGAAFRRAWMEATKPGVTAMRASDAAKAASPADTAMVLFQLALELGDAAGVPRTAFTAAFNDRGESGAVTPAAMLDEIVARVGTLILSIALARQAALATDTDDDRASA